MQRQRRCLGDETFNLAGMRLLQRLPLHLQCLLLHPHPSQLARYPSQLRLRLGSGGCLLLRLCPARLRLQRHRSAGGLLPMRLSPTGLLLQQGTERRLLPMLLRLRPAPGRWRAPAAAGWPAGARCPAAPASPAGSPSQTFAAPGGPGCCWWPSRCHTEPQPPAPVRRLPGSPSGQRPRGSAPLQQARQSGRRAAHSQGEGVSGHASRLVHSSEEGRLEPGGFLSQPQQQPAFPNRPEGARAAEVSWRQARQPATHRRQG